MRILFNLLVFILLALLMIGSFISMFTNQDLQDVLNNDSLSLASILDNFGSLETPDFILDIKEWLSKLQIPVPDVPVIREITNFMNASIRFSLFFFNMLLDLLDILSKFITLIFAYL